jgi:hypothetical protein
MIQCHPGLIQLYSDRIRINPPDFWEASGAETFAAAWEKVWRLLSL